MNGKILGIGLIAVLLALSGAGSVSAETDNSVKIYISIDADQVDIWIEGSNLGDELATINAVETVVNGIDSGLRQLYGITGNIYYHVNELDTNQKQGLRRLTVVEDELKEAQMNIGGLAHAHGSLWVRVDDAVDQINQLQVLVLCLFATGVCIATVFYCQVPSGKSVRELEKRVRVLENKIKKKG